MEKIDCSKGLEKEKVFKGAVPYWADKDPLFLDFLETRDLAVREYMSSMHERVTEASRQILKVDICHQVEDFKAYVCPVKVKLEEEFTHPIILAYCKWEKFSAMLHWPMEMIPLTNLERKQVWEEFVKDDEVYYQRVESHHL
jgi:hypothetical protein